MAGYFSQDTFRFLNDLKKNNDREWFKANKDRYEAFVKEPFLEFISNAGPPLRKISKNIVADPRPVGGSLFRVYRDVRFSKDKSPYKTHGGASFRHAAGKHTQAPGYYLHIEPGGCFIAGGMYMPDGKALLKIRETIVEYPDRWKAVRKKVSLAPEDSLVRAPKGFDPDHPFIEDLKLKHYIAATTLTQGQVCSTRFMDDFIEECKSMAPLMSFLASAVGVAW